MAESIEITFNARTESFTNAFRIGAELARSLADGDAPDHTDDELIVARELHRACYPEEYDPDYPRTTDPVTTPYTNPVASAPG